MMLAGLIGASGWYYLANYANTPFEATAGSIVASLGVAISDVVADSIVVEKVRPTVLFCALLFTQCNFVLQHYQIVLLGAQWRSQLTDVS